MIKMVMYEIRWHGRGGQGGVTAAQLLAEAAYLSGKWPGVQAFPFFGAERRGAPVKAFTRISDKPINIRSQVYTPDVVVVLDPTLLDAVNVLEGLKENGKIIINTPKKASELNLDTKAEVWTFDGTGIALELGLLVSGLPVLNTPMMGAYAKATGHISVEDAKKAIMNKWPGKPGELNAKAAEIAFERVSKD